MAGSLATRDSAPGDSSRTVGYDAVGAHPGRGHEAGTPEEATMTQPPDTADRLKERVEGLGREAQTAGERLARDPSVLRVADTGARLWGVVVLAVGLWFFADVTLGLPMPTIAWRDLWPVALVLLGVFVIARGMTRWR